MLEVVCCTYDPVLYWYAPVQANHMIIWYSRPL